MSSFCLKCAYSYKLKDLTACHGGSDHQHTPVAFQATARGESALAGNKLASLGSLQLWLFILGHSDRWTLVDSHITCALGPLVTMATLNRFSLRKHMCSCFQILLTCLSNTSLCLCHTKTVFFHYEHVMRTVKCQYNEQPGKTKKGGNSEMSV